MPWGNGTGPLGFGPKTGRGSGHCAGYSVPGYMNPIPGRGFWGCSGRAHGYRHWFYATGLPGWMKTGGVYSAFGRWPMPYRYEMDPKEEVDILKRQEEFFKKQLEEIQNRISTLEKEEENKQE